MSTFESNIVFAQLLNFCHVDLQMLGILCVKSFPNEM